MRLYEIVPPAEERASSKSSKISNVSTSNQRVPISAEPLGPAIKGGLKAVGSSEPNRSILTVYWDGCDKQF